MPIINQQRALVEVGRLRMGEKKIARSGKSYPVKGTTWRLTSRDRARLDAAAAIYGGTVREWEDQYELITITDSIEVAVVPGQALSQYMEHWGQRHPKNHKGPNPVLCLLRCDSVTELLQDRPCVCKLSGNEQCKPTTRLSVMLRRVPGVGVWRLDTRGQIAAGELIAGVELLEMLTATNRPVRARLRLDQRSSIDRETGETHNFVVPVLDIDMTLDEALDTLNGVVRPELGAGAQQVSPPEAVAVAAGPGFTPVAELPAAPVGTIGEQVAGAGRERQARRGGAEPIRPTGRRPRAAAEVVEAGTAAVSTGGEPVHGVDAGSPPGPAGGEHREDDAVDTVESVPADSGAASPSTASPVQTARAQQVAMRCRDVGIESDEHRHAFLNVVTDGRASSGKDLDDTDFALVQEALRRVAAGQLRIVHGLDGLRVEEVGESATADDPAWWDADQWKTHCKARGLTQAKVIRQAKRITDELGLPAPSDLGAWTDGRVSEQLLAWIDEQAAA